MENIGRSIQIEEGYIDLLNQFVVLRYPEYFIDSQQNRFMPFVELAFIDM